MSEATLLMLLSVCPSCLTNRCFSRFVPTVPVLVLGYFLEEKKTKQYIFKYFIHRK